MDDEEPETNSEEVLTLLIAATESFDEKNEEYLKLEQEYEEAKRVSYHKLIMLYRHLRYAE